MLLEERKNLYRAASRGGSNWVKNRHESEGAATVDGTVHNMHERWGQSEGVELPPHTQSAFQSVNILVTRNVRIYTVVGLFDKKQRGILREHKAVLLSQCCHLVQW